jgi:hypothetical protein
MPEVTGRLRNRKWTAVKIRIATREDVQGLHISPRQRRWPKSMAMDVVTWLPGSVPHALSGTSATAALDLLP